MSICPNCAYAEQLAENLEILHDAMRLGGLTHTQGEGYAGSPRCKIVANLLAKNPNPSGQPTTEPSPASGGDADPAVTNEDSGPVGLGPSRCDCGNPDCAFGRVPLTVNPHDAMTTGEVNRAIEQLLTDQPPGASPEHARQWIVDAVEVLMAVQAREECEVNSEPVEYVYAAHFKPDGPVENLLQQPPCPCCGMLHGPREASTEER